MLAVWKDFCRALGATVSLSSGYHPESNGQAERENLSTLRYMVSTNQTTWVAQLPCVEYAHNTLPTTATGISPFQHVYGFQPQLFPSLEKEISVPSVQAHIRRCHRTWHCARTSLLRMAAQYQHYANRRRIPAPSYTRGDKVWLSTKDLLLKSQEAGSQPHCGQA